MTGPRYSLRMLWAAVVAAAIGCALVSAAAHLEDRSLPGISRATLAVMKITAPLDQGWSRAYSEAGRSSHFLAKTVEHDRLPTVRVLKTSCQRFVGLPTTLAPEESA